MDNYNSRRSTYEYEDVPSQASFDGSPRRRKKGNLWFAAGIVTGIIGCLVVSGIALAAGGGSLGGNKTGSTNSTLDSQTLEKLGVLEHYIDTYYLDADTLTADQKRDGLYKGLFASLGDPYSA